MSPFCGATATLVLDFWWRLLWVSKPEWVLPYLSLAEAYMLRYTFPEIQLWCNTCWPLGSQHGSRAVSSTYLRGIGGTQNRELSCRRSQCEIRQTLYRLSYPGSARYQWLNISGWKVVRYIPFNFFPSFYIKEIFLIVSWSGKDTVTDLWFLGGTNPRVDCTNYLWQTFLPKTAWKWKELKREGLDPPLKWPPLASPTQFLEPLLYCSCPLIHWPLPSTFANPPIWWFSSSHNNGMSVRI